VQTMAYSEPGIDQDAQVDPETVLLSDDSSDEYQNSHRSDGTELDTEPDAEDNTASDRIVPGLGHRSQKAYRQRNGRTTLRISTTSG